MKKVIVVGIMVILLSAVLWKNHTAAAEKNHVEETASISQQIHGATVLIVMVVPNAHATADSTGTFLGYGMGTLVKAEGGVWLVTHNHYGEALQDLTIVELRDADNRMIRPMLGNEFKSLIVYQDPGTLVLRAPDYLTDSLTPAEVGDVSRVKAGELVRVAYRAGAQRSQAAVIEAVIEEVSTSGGVPVYKIRNRNGQFFQPGDSGGGVWYEGRLVGNMWWVRAVSDQNILVASGEAGQANWVLTDTSYAAAIPLSIP